MNRISIGLLAAALGLVAGACSIDVERNPDGSLQISSVLTEESMQSEINRGIDDPAVRELTVDMKDGYALVAAEKDEPSGAVSAIDFRVDLAVVDGHLGVTISDAVWNGFPIPEPIVEVWNDNLALVLEEAGREHPDATLVDVSLTEDALSMEWHVETEESKS